jgi:hypothetical protein
MMIHKLQQHNLSLNVKHFLGLELRLHEILTCVFTKKLMFLLLHNHTLDIFLIWKGHMGNKLSFSLLLVSLIFLSHFFHHILFLLEHDQINNNDLPTLDCQLGLPLEKSILCHSLNSLAYISSSVGISNFSKISSSSSL